MIPNRKHTAHKWHAWYATSVAYIGSYHGKGTAGRDFAGKGRRKYWFESTPQETGR